MYKKPLVTAMTILFAVSFIEVPIKEQVENTTIEKEIAKSYTEPVKPLTKPAYVTPRSSSHGSIARHPVVHTSAPSTPTPKNTPTNKKVEAEIIVKEKDFDIDKLARAVARHETGNCTLGYGATYNNCFGIKDGNTAPCKKIGKNRMCIYDTPEESYEAFKKIWSKWYGELPTLEDAKTWSGNDNAKNWRANVLQFYNA